MSKSLKLCFLSFILCFFSSVSFGKVTASVERDKVAVGDTVNYTITADSVFDSCPIIPNKDNVFRVLGNSKSSSVNIVNAHVTRETRCNYAISFNKVGSFSIPSTKINGEATKPVSVSVVKGSDTTIDGQSKDVFIKSNVSTTSPYVNQQVLYTLKLYYNSALVSGAIPEPNFKGVEVEPLGDDIHYQTMVNHKNYNVVERRFALFFQQPGKYNLPKSEFDGTVRAGNPNGDNMNAFFMVQSTKPIRLFSKPHDLMILNQPANSSNNWLPATAMELTQSWSEQTAGAKQEEHPTLKVGVPVTLTLTLKATGLPANQLPELVDSSQFKNVSVYPDNPGLHTAKTKDGVEGIRQEKIAIIPQTQGNLEIPAISVRWFNTKTKKFEVASVPAQTLTVKPSANMNVPVQHANTPTQTQQSTQVIVKEKSSKGLWVAIIVLFVLWVLTLLAWLFSKGAVRSSGNQKQKTISSNKNISLIKQACKNNDASAAKDAIVSWGKQTFSGYPINNVLNVANQVDDEPLITELKNLDRAVYTNQEWSGARLYRTFTLYLRKSNEDGKCKPEDDLDPLYPKK